MSTIVDRGYVWKKGSALVPSFTAFAVVRLLEEHFTALVDYDFTRNMEEVLDLIAAGETDRVAQLEAFWRGGHSVSGDFPGVKPLTEDLGAIDARAIATMPISGSDASLRVGRYGAYVERGEERANIPVDMAPDELDRGDGREAARRAVRRPCSSAPIPERPGDRREVRPLRPVRHRGAAGGLAEVGEAADRIAVQRHDARPRSLSSRHCASSACRGWSAPTPRTASTSPRRTAATARTC